MKKLLVFFFLLASAVPKAQCQSRVNPAAIKLFKSIQSSVCKEDTAKAIEQLLQFERLFPKDGNIITTNRVLGELLLKQGKTDSSIKALRYALDYKPENNLLWFIDSAACDKAGRTFPHPIGGSGRANVCVSLSQSYLQIKQYDSSLHYLKLADNEYLPYRDCANGVYMYRSYLSTYFADYYLAVGDTASAIARLLDYFTEPDGNMKRLSGQLKSILLTRYSQAQIKKEIQKGIEKLAIDNGKKNKYSRVLVFKIFNHTIRKSAYQESLAYWKKEILHHKSIQQLLN